MGPTKGITYQGAMKEHSYKKHSPHEIEKDFK